MHQKIVPCTKKKCSVYQKNYSTCVKIIPYTKKIILSV